MKKLLYSTTIAAFAVFAISSAVPSVEPVKAAEIPAAIITSESAEWIADPITQNIPSWFNDQTINDLLRTKISTSKKEYHFIHMEGETLKKENIVSFVEGEIEILPEENGKQANLIAIGYYTINGKKNTDFYFSNIDNTPLKDIKKYAVEIATQVYAETNSFTKQRNIYTEPPAVSLEQNNSITAAAVPVGTSYVDTFHWAIYSDQEKLSDGSYVVAGLLDSTVEYSKQGTAISNGKTVSVWDVKASNQTRAVNGYQTRQIATRHTVEPYVPDQKLLSYGPTTTIAGSNFNVSLTGGLPSVSWDFSRQSVDVTDNSSQSLGFGKWTFDFPLGTKVAKGTYLMQPGIRVSNASGQVKFQHSHSGYYYQNISYQGTGVTGLVARSFNDL